ncbi:hypothetical protein [Blastococcus colisei]|nr:hypothetical protein [Blastococcus colisei]
MIRAPILAADAAVDADLEQVAGRRRDAVLRLGELCLEHLPGYWRGPIG